MIILNNIPFFPGLAVEQATSAHMANMPEIKQQMVKHGIINIIHECLAGTYKNGTAKDWGKSIRTFSQLILQEETMTKEVDGQCH